MMQTNSLSTSKDNVIVVAKPSSLITDTGKNRTIIFQDSGSGVRVALNADLQSAAITSGGDAQGAVIKGFVNVTGSHYDDTITGVGSSVLTGGGGNDTFVYMNTSPSLVSNYDTMTDFSGSDFLKIGHAVASSDFKTVVGQASGSLSEYSKLALDAITFTQNCAAMVILKGTASDAGNYAVISVHDQNQVGFIAAGDIVVNIKAGVVSAGSFIS